MKTQARRKLDRNVLDLVTGVAAVVGAMVVVLTHFTSTDLDWSALQLLLALVTVTCVVTICYELICNGYKGSVRFAVVEMAGGAVVSFALFVLLAVDIAVESGLFLILSLFGYVLIIVGVVCNWRVPLSGQRSGLHFDARCKF